MIKDFLLVLAWIRPAIFDSNLINWRGLDLQLSKKKKGSKR